MPAPTLPRTLAAAAAALLCLTPLLAGPPDGGEPPVAMEMGPPPDQIAPETWTADDFAGFLVGGRPEIPGPRGRRGIDRLVLEGWYDGDPEEWVRLEAPDGFRVTISESDFEEALRRVGRPVPDEPGTRFEPARELKESRDLWSGPAVRKFLDGRMREYLSAVPFRQAGPFTQILLKPRYGTEERRVFAPSNSLLEELENYGLTLEIGRDYRPGEGDPATRWDGEDMQRFFEGGRDEVQARITAIDERNVEFEVTLRPDPDGDASETVRRVASVGTVKRAFGQHDVPAEQYAVGAVIEPVGGDARTSAGADDEAGADRTAPRAEGGNPPPAELAGLWSADDLSEFLAGRRPWIESVTVLSVPAGDVFFGNPPVTLRVRLKDSEEPQAGTITGLEVREVLGRYGLSVRAGQTLRPLPGAKGVEFPPTLQERLVSGLGGSGFGKPGSGGPAADGIGGTSGSSAGGFSAAPTRSGGSEAGDRRTTTDIAALVAAARDADDDARTAAAAKLHGALAEQFDARQAARESDLAALEAKVAKLRDLHDRRAAAKKEIVADRVETLLNEAAGLGWGEPGAEPPAPPRSGGLGGERPRGTARFPSPSLRGGRGSGADGFGIDAGGTDRETKAPDEDDDRTGRAVRPPQTNQELANAVAAKLRTAGETGRDVRVRVKGGVCRLVGTVPDRAAKNRLTILAVSVPGVTEVLNEMRVGASRGPFDSGGYGDAREAEPDDGE